MDFLEKYGNAKPDVRIDLILDYYHSFPAIIEGQQKVLIRRIKNEYDYMHQKHKDDLGIRIQNFKLSDPTAKEAIQMVCIENAVMSGKDIDEFLDELDQQEIDFLSRNLYLLGKMKEEYELINNSLMFLNSTEKHIFKLYTENDCDVHRLAVMEGIQNNTVSKRVWRVRKKIKEGTVSSMTENL